MHIFLLFFILSNKTLAFFRINIYTSTGIEIHTFEYGFSFGAWLSLVERFVRDEEVAGSNPVAPIFLCSFLRAVIKQSVFPNLKNGRTHYPLLRKTFALYSNATVLSSPPLAAH